MLPFGHGGDQESGKTDCPHSPAAPQRSLHFKRAVPAFVMGGKPFVDFRPVGSDQVEFGGGTWRPAELEFDDTASRDQPGFNQGA